MHKCLIAVVAVALLSAFAIAQEGETPKAEIFGGYQYTRVSGGGTGINANGWNASLTGNFNQHLGVAADFSGAYKTISGVSFKVYSYTFGPVVSLNHSGKINPFVHALFGGAHAAADAGVFGAGSDNGFTMAMGGGVDARVSRNFAIRVVQADWVYYHFSGVGESKNARISTGVVLRF
ncbi:MAG TPA: outer membrane beta-barrel protein [Terriglobales bacterium]|nr:outer membrane beta-barrel protein [Terriglobales bacterium]